MSKTRLTKAIVDTAKTDKAGEYWIADTVVRGFGLRVWRTSCNSTGKAFAIRTQDTEGKQVRKTFDANLHLARLRDDYYWGLRTSEETLTLGDLCSTARDWAIDQISKLQGRPTLDDEKAWQLEIVRRRVDQYTVSKVSDVLLKGRQKRGVSLPHLDRLTNLLYKGIPSHIKTKYVKDLTESDILLVLTSDCLTDSDFRAIRQPIRQMLEIADSYGSEPLVEPWRIDKLAQSAQKVRAANKALNLDEELIVKIVQSVDTIQDTRSRLAIRIYLHSSASIKSILNARWAALVYRNFEKDDWFSPKAHAKLYLKVSQKPFRDLLLWEQDYSDIKILLHERQIDRDEFIFTSDAKPSCPMSSVERVWQKFSSPYLVSPISLSAFRKLARSYQVHPLTSFENAAMLDPIETECG